MKKMATGFALTAFFLFLGLFYLFTDRYLREKINPNQNVSASLSGALILKSAADGHYRVSGLVNNQPVVFLLDTGATQVAIGQELAMDLGVSRGAGISVFTANGEVQGYRTKIASLQFAGFSFQHVPALIMPKMDREVLLGMSILQKFHWQQENGTLRLSAP